MLQQEAVIAVSILVVLLGVYLLLQRVMTVAKQRRSTMRTAAGTTIPATAAKSQTRHTHPQGETFGPITRPDYTSTLELQLRDANNALFMTLLECCGMILEGEEPSSATMRDAVLYAKNLRESGRSAMTNKEIADHSYQLAAQLRSSGDAVMTAIRRVLTQLAAAERWGLQLP